MFLKIAAALFALVALGHLLRIAFEASVTIQGVSIPVWVSWPAFFVAGFLAYEGFDLALRAR
jgi:hypothetical protein